MQTNTAKDNHIQAAYHKIMSLPTEQEQNIAALVMDAYGQGLNTGVKMRKLRRKPKQDKSA